MTPIQRIRARLIAVEKTLNELVAGLIAQPDTVAEVERLRKEFRSTSHLLHLGGRDDEDDRKAAAVVARVNGMFDVVAARVLRNIHLNAWTK